MLKQYTSMPRGDIDGPNLNDGTQVKLPPHLTFSWSSRATVQSSRSCSQRTRSLSASSCCQLARTLLSFLRCVLRVDETMYLTELHMNLSSGHGEMPFVEKSLSTTSSGAWIHQPGRHDLQRVNGAASLARTR
jgi:hypothetical protein